MVRPNDKHEQSTFGRERYNFGDPFVKTRGAHFGTLGIIQGITPKHLKVRFPETGKTTTWKYKQVMPAAPGLKVV